MRVLLAASALIGIGCGAPSRPSADVYDVMADDFESACGNGRWAVKTGTDADASRVTREPVQTTISDLLRMSGEAPRLDIRQPPVEFTTWRVRNVLLSQFDFTWDKDAMLVLSDGASSLTAALPAPACVRAASPFRSSIAVARAALPGAGEVVTVDGVGFIDPRGRVGLHPIPAICA